MLIDNRFLVFGSRFLVLGSYFLVGCHVLRAHRMLVAPLVAHRRLIDIDGRTRGRG